jgi:hypothetical protein
MPFRGSVQLKLLAPKTRRARTNQPGVQVGSDEWEGSAMVVVATFAGLTLLTPVGRGGIDDETP